MGDNLLRIVPAVQQDTTTQVPNVSRTDIAIDPGDWRFVGAAIGLLVAVLGTAGNGLTVWAYKSNRNLQTSFNVLIANLCCVELLFSLVIIPLQLPGMFMAILPYPTAFCTILGYIYYCSFAASLHNLVAIAINRYVGIVNTKRYQGMFTGHRLRIWVISIWVTSPILYIPHIVGGNIGWRKNSLRCSIKPGSSAVGVYNMILNIILQAGGLIMLVVLYSAIIKKVRRVQQKLKVHKKASFRSSGASARRPGTTSRSAKAETHTPGTTSGEEDIDDYRPSSIISGGFNFRPAKGGSHHEWQSDSGPSDREMVSARVRNLMSDNNQSHASNMTPLRSPSPNPEKGKRRVSIWHILFRTKDKDQRPEKNSRSHTGDNTTDDESKKDHTNEADEQLQKVNVTLRNMDEVKKNLRRKKSLSAPTMPTPEEIMASRKNSSIVTSKIPEKLEESHETPSAESSPTMNRSYTIGAKYQKRIHRGVNSGSFRIPSESIKFLHPNFGVSRLTAENRAACSSLPSLQPNGISPLETGYHMKSGTIAKKIKGQKSRRDRRTKRKERMRAMKRRHNRERQLVYSSLSICIAYAVLILPSSLLHVVQIMFNFTAPAPAVLMIGTISWFHAVVNPFIYGYMNHLYRKEYGKIAKSMEKRIMTCVK